MTVAKKAPAPTGVAIDQSDEALAMATKKAERHALAERLEFRAGDWTAGVDGPFDLVVSTPSCIANADFETMMPEGKDFERRLALDGGADGIDCYRRLAATTLPLARPGGRHLLEIGAGKEGAVRGLLEAAVWRLLPTTPVVARILRIIAAECPEALS